ncbi:MAG: D-alanyl-D-alanine carboxypeptidase/D-alanyl-D-alanine-endopeptidase [Gemmatimonadaceae bacterium]
MTSLRNLTTPQRAPSSNRTAHARPTAFLVRGLMQLAMLPAVLFSAGCASSHATVSPAPRSPVAELRRAVDSMVSDPKFRTAQLGILVVDPERGDTLYSHNAGKLFVPASNQKILTGATALHLLGPGYRFVTTVAASGPVQSGIVNGDLVVVGTGDPSVSDQMAGDGMAPLRTMADSLSARGVRRVSGVLAAGGDAFPDAALGFGWAWDDLDFAYSAGVDELFFNEGFARVVVRGGGQAGTTPTVATAPARTVPAVRLLARTVAPGGTVRRGPQAVRVRQDSADASAIIVEGDIGAGDSVALTIAHRDQRGAYLRALLEALGEKGIVVDGGVSRELSAPTYPLFSVPSPPLAAILRAFEKPSQNQIGEILLKTLGRAKAGVGVADSGARVVRDQLLAWGAAPDGFVIRDGSGLSRHNVVTPETIVRVLAAIRRDTAFASFQDALPVAGVDGTIASRMRGTPAQGNVHAKTGTLDMVRSLSGYVTTADGRVLIFSVLSNNVTVPLREVERVQDALAVRLAQLRLGDR